MPTATVLDILNLQSICQRRVDDHNKLNGASVKVKFVDSPTAATDGSTISIPHPRLPVTTDELDLLYGYVVHETGHLSRPEIFPLIEELNCKDPHEPIFALTNILEDQAMEREVAMRFKGDRLALSKCQVQHMKKQLNVLANFEGELSEDQIKAAAAYCAAITTRADWDVNAMSQVNSMLELCPDTVSKLYDAIVKDGWIPTLKAIGDPEHTIVVAKKFHDYLYPPTDKPKPPEPPPEPPKGEDKPCENGNDKDSDKPKPKPEAVKEKKPLQWGDLPYGTHTKTQDDSGGADENHPAVDYNRDSAYSGGVEFLPPNKIKEIVSCPSDSELELDGNTLVNKMRIYLQSLKRTRIVGDKDSGALYSRELYRLAMPRIDNGDWNRKIFYTKEMQQQQDTAIALLVDWSGSMSGTRMKLARHAACKLANLFDKLLKVPTFVGAFTTGWSDEDYEPTCLNAIIKDYTERTNIQKISDRLKGFARESSGNSDADSILWCYNKLAKRKESRKILIVLTDGEPTDGAGNAEETLSYTTKLLNKIPNLSVGAIGIQHRGVRKYYDNYRIVQELGELDNELFSLLRELYTKG